MQLQRQAMAMTAAQILNSRVIVSNVLEEIGLLIPRACPCSSMTLTVPPYMVAGANDAAAGAPRRTLGAPTSPLTGDANGSYVSTPHTTR